MSKKVLTIAIAVLVLSLVGDVQAANVTWTDTTGDHLWSTPENWSSGTVPTSDDNVKINLVPGAIIANEGKTTPQAEKVLTYLKSLGNGSYMFGQMATWVHNENPDMDHPSNWLKKVYDHTGKMPRYGCLTYDFHDDPFPDSAWNNGVKKMWDRGMIVGVFTFYANPTGKSWNGPVDIDPIFAPDDNPTKDNFYKQMDRMAANLQWLKVRGVPVVYTPFGGK